MRVIQEKEIRDLRRTRNVVDEKGERLKPALFHKKSKLPLSPEEKQTLALEKIATEIALVLQANDKKSIILLEMIRKMKTEPIRIPAFPEPATEWKHTIISRDSDGKAKDMTSKRVK